MVTADEPGQHSSQNEQDNRGYAKMAKMPMLEPSDSQECKDMIALGMEISEQFDTPLLMRVTTRVCHSKSIVQCEPRKEVGVKEYKKISTSMSPCLLLRANGAFLLKNGWKNYGSIQRTHRSTGLK